MPPEMGSIAEASESGSFNPKEWILRRVTVVDEENIADIIPLSQEVCTVGRRESNTIVLTSQKFKKLVSREHAKFVWNSAGWKVFDLESTNGVLVNHVKVEEAPLEEGDKISFVRASGKKIGEVLHDRRSLFEYRLERQSLPATTQGRSSRKRRASGGRLPAVKEEAVNSELLSNHRNSSPSPDRTAATPEAVMTPGPAESTPRTKRESTSDFGDRGRDKRARVDSTSTSATVRGTAEGTNRIDPSIFAVVGASGGDGGSDAAGLPSDDEQSLWSQWWSWFGQLFAGS